MENIEQNSQKSFKNTKFFHFLEKIGTGLKWAYLGKFRWYFIMASLLLLVYLSYFIFVFRFNNTTFNLTYDNGLSTLDSIRLPMGVTALIIIIILIIKAIYDLAKRNLTFSKAVFILLALGVLMRITYMVYTPIYFNYGTWKQHDLSYGGQYGHYSITMYIYRNWQIPDMARTSDGAVDFAKSGQLYQPKLAHIFQAIFMKINSIFVHFGDELAVFKKSDGTLYNMDNITMNEYALYEMNRILMCFGSIATLMVLYNIIKEINLSNKGKLIALAMCAFCPVFYMFSTSLNNDSLSFLFAFLALLYAIKWAKKPGFKNIIFIAIYLGLGMSCKLSVGFFALPIAIMFLYKFVKIILAVKKGEEEKKYLLKSILMFVVFAFIVFPIGLSYPIYAKIRFDQPFNYVWLISKYNWNYIDESIFFFRRFLIYPSSDFFKSIFVYNGAYKDGAIDPNIQPNLRNYVLKSSLFGEYGWSRLFSTVLYIAAFILMWVIIALMVYILVKAIMKKKVDLSILLVVAILGATYYISAIIFNIQYPFTCSQDFRYFVPLILVAGTALGRGLDVLNESDKKINKYLTYIISSLVLVYSISSITTYLIP